MSRASIPACLVAATFINVLAPPAGAQTIPLARADVDRDCVVTRADATIVQSLIGRRTGQAGFNPAADVDQNGVINNVDATFVTRNIGKTVCSTNRPPTFTSQPVLTGRQLEPYAYVARATDPDNDPVTFSLPSPPPGMTIGRTSGAIDWMPPGTGSLDVAIRAEDGRGGVATQTFTIVVTQQGNRPPQMGPLTNRRIAAGSSFALGLQAHDPDPFDTLSFDLVSGPAGAAVSPSPVVTWTPAPNQVGTYQFTVRVRDAAGASANGAFSVEVVNSDGAPVLDDQPDAVVPPAALFSRVVGAIDPNPGDVLTFSLAGGPADLALSSDGVLSWTPTAAQAGSHLVKLLVRDPGGLVDAAAFTITVDTQGPSLPPTAVDDEYAVRRQGTLEVPAPGVLLNDTDPAGRPLVAELVGGPAKGTATLSPSGALTYTPTAPLPGSTAPVQAFAVSYNDGTPMLTTNAQPLVADLDGNGQAEIVFLAVGAFAQRRILAINGATGAVVWAVNAYQPAANPMLKVCFTFCEMAAADLDGDGRIEVLAVHSDDETSMLRRRLVAFNYDGTHRWTSDDVLDGVNVLQTSGMFWPYVADLDGDGSPEILALHHGKSPATPANVSAEDLLTVFDRNGHIKWTRRIAGGPSDSELTVADIDLDGSSDIVVGGAVLDYAGNVKWNIKAVPNHSPLGLMAVGNLDDDPFPEIVYQDQFRNLLLYEHTGAKTWGPVRLPSLSDYGPPSIADVDGDGRAEILRASDGVEVWDRNGNLVREMELPAPHMAYGGIVTVFDLNGDGRPEVFLHGARGPYDAGFARGALYIFDGPSGALLHSMPASRNGGGNVVMPLIADVNGDGSAEIVTGGWDQPSALLRVFKAASGKWAQTRPIWNQMSYHVTNVGSDGRIPAHPAVHWLTPGLNMYRSNVPLPEERTGDVDQLTYVADNGALTSNIATVRIDILPPNGAPRIVSLAPTAGARGIEYLYAVRALDPDPGELLEFSLPIAPAGMVVDPSTGLVRWTPAQESSAPVMAVVKVTDSQGESDSQQFAIGVGVPVAVPAVVGQLLGEAQTLLTNSGFAIGGPAMSPSATVPAGRILSQEPLGGTLVAGGARIALIVSSGPAPVPVPAVIGMTEFAATRKMEQFGFAPLVVRAFSNTVTRGQVIAQVPSAGTLVTDSNATLTVSAGSGLSVRLPRDLTGGGEAIGFTAAAYDLTLAEFPTSGLTFAITPTKTPHFGHLPTVAGQNVLTSADTRGAFRLTATDPATGRTATADFAVTFPRSGSGLTVMDLYAGMGTAIADLNALAAQARTALALGDESTMRSLLAQMVQRWRLVDTRQLRLTTPFVLPEGYFPAPSELAGLGLSPTADDLLAQQVLVEAQTDLEAWIAGLQESSTSMTTLEALADGFNTRVARLSTLTLSEWGVIKAQPLFTILLSDLYPALFDALMNELEQVVAQSAPGPGPSTLIEQVTTIAVKYTIEKVLEETNPFLKARSDMLENAAWGAAAVMAAQHFKQRVNGQELTAVVAGASLSFRVFGAGYSFIEADLDMDHPANNVVITIGPDQIEAAEPELGETIINEVALQGLVPDEVYTAGATSVKLGDAMLKVYDWLKKGQSSAPGVVDVVAGAFQGRGAGYRGCVFSSSPTCGQLVYPGGFHPVYTYDPSEPFASFAGLPVPILFMVYNKTTGVIYVDTPVFLPAPKED